MRIAWISADWSRSMLDAKAHPLPGGAGWYRCALPAAEMAKHGHTTTHVPNLAVLRSGEIVPVTWDDNMDLSGYDVVVLQRWMHHEGAAVVRKARATGQVVLNDVDDWFDGLDPANAAFAATHPRLNTVSNRNHYRSIVAASSAIVCSTPFLAQRLGRQAPAVVVRNAIDLHRWPVTRKEPPTTVGWVGATAWRSGDLETLRGVLGPFLRKHGLRFVHHGCRSDMADAAQLAGVDDDVVGPFRPMVSIADYPSLFTGIHIGVVPLRDTPFNQSKSAIKGIELSASGIPFVAQATDEYRWFDNETCARRPRDWIRQLTRLLDPAVREAEAVRLRAKAEALDIAQRWVDWESAFAALR